MKWRMNRLAERFACHFGGGGVGSSVTSAETPPELKPLVNATVERMMGLQNFLWGNPNDGSWNVAGANDQTIQPPDSSPQPGGWGYDAGASPSSFMSSAPGAASSPSAPGTMQLETGGFTGGMPQLTRDIQGGAPPQADSDFRTFLPEQQTRDDIVPKQRSAAEKKLAMEGRPTSISEAGGWNPLDMSSPMTKPSPTTQATNTVTQTPIQNIAPPEDPGDYVPDPEPVDMGEGRGINILGRQARPIAGASDLQREAGNQIQDRYGATRGEAMSGDLIGDAQWAARQENAKASKVNEMADMRIGNNPAQDAGVQNAMSTFQNFMQPVIQDQSSLMGNARGSSNLLNQQLGMQAALTPEISKFQQRESDRINRMTGAEENRINRINQSEEQGLNRQVQAALGGAGAANQLGGLEAQREAGVTQDLSSLGGTQRQIQQERLDAPYADWLRRANLAENSLNSIFGSMVPSTIGSSTRSVGGGK